MARERDQRLMWCSHLLLRSGGIGAVVSFGLLVVGLGSALLIPDEDLAEFVFAAAPLLARLALAPTLGSLYWLYRLVAPRLSLSMLLLGGLGLSAFVLLPVLYVQCAVISFTGTRCSNLDVYVVKTLQGGTGVEHLVCR